MLTVFDFGVALSAKTPLGALPRPAVSAEPERASKADEGRQRNEKNRPHDEHIISAEPLQEIRGAETPPAASQDHSDPE